jgi:hypothetical protein
MVSPATKGMGSTASNLLFQNSSIDSKGKHLVDLSTFFPSIISSWRQKLVKPLTENYIWKLDEYSTDQTIISNNV